MTESQASALKAMLTGNRLDQCKHGEIVKLLQELLVLIGAGDSNIPEKPEIAYLAQTAPFVIGKWTLAEIRHAFFLAMKGEIEYNLNLYDKPLSIMYISNLMKVYAAYRGDAQFKATRNEPEAAIPPSDADRYKLMKDFALRSFDNHCKGAATWADYPFTLYKWLEKIGVLKQSPELIGKFEAMAFVLVKSEMADEAYTKDLRTMIEALTPGNSSVQAKTYEFLLKLFFDDLVRQGEKLEDLL